MLQINYSFYKRIERTFQDLNIWSMVLIYYLSFGAWIIARSSKVN
ncbi:MAG: hypothetical protein K0R51_1025 [Cytophagaceae bacterium]|jgi:hypothetical protein|nr:hypothetical protein [Cytophagaceae bacterium]